MVLVVIIVAAWGVILGPNLLKRRSRAGGINSISHFHRSLRILERSGPQPIVTPAYRLRSVSGSGLAGQDPAVVGGPVMPVLTVVGADQLPRPALAFLGDDPVRWSASPQSGALEAHLGSSATALDRDTDAHHVLRASDALVRHQVRKRRRDTLGILAMVFVGSLMIGCIPGAGAAWLLSAVAGVALACYLWLLVHLRQLAEERERKLHYLSPAMSGASLPASRSAQRGVTSRAVGGIGSMGGVGVPVYMSGRYAHPSNQAAVGH